MYSFARECGAAIGILLKHTDRHGQSKETHTINVGHTWAAAASV